MSLSKKLRITVIVVSLGSMSLTGVAGSTQLPTRPSLHQLEKDLGNSAKLKVSPPLNDLIPTLQSMTYADITMIPMPSECYGSWPPSEPQPVPSNASAVCAWGDLRAKRSIFLFGDSQAAMWLPAFNALGIDLGWRIVFLGKPSCSPWITTAKWNYGDGSAVYSDASCEEFVRNVIEYVNSFHPTFVIPIGLALLSSNYKTVAVNSEKQATLKTINALKPSGARVLLLEGISSMYSGVTPQQCLLIHDTDLPSCEIKVSQLKTYAQYEGLTLAAAQAHVPVIPTLRLFCAKEICPIVVKSGESDHLVYYDLGHMNNKYSAWISVALEALLKAYLLQAA